RTGRRRSGTRVAPHARSRAADHRLIYIIYFHYLFINHIPSVILDGLAPSPASASAGSRSSGRPPGSPRPHTPARSGGPAPRPAAIGSRARTLPPRAPCRAARPRGSGAGRTGSGPGKPAGHVDRAWRHRPHDPDVRVLGNPIIPTHDTESTLT